MDTKEEILSLDDLTPAPASILVTAPIPLPSNPEPTFLKSLPRFPSYADSTAMKMANDCLRKYFYRIKLGRVPPVSKYQVIFDFGSAYHKFREVLEIEFTFNKKSRMEALTAALTAIQDMPLARSPLKKWEFYTRGLLLESCNKAFKWWCAEKDKGVIEVVGVEQPFNIQLPNGTFIYGRADQIIRWNGKLWGRDFKTTTKELQYFEATLDPNDQATRYIFAESKLHYGSEAIDNGKQIQGIIFEVLQNDGKQTNSNRGKISNVTITKNSYQLKQWLKEQIFFDKILSLCEEEDIWPMQTHSCSFCDYHTVCKKASEEAIAYELKANFKLSPWDPSHVDQVVMNEI